jgi:hypothetical protein
MLFKVIMQEKIPPMFARTSCPQNPCAATTKLEIMECGI